MEKIERFETSGGRAIGRSETTDFRRFPVSQMILEPTPDMRPADVLCDLTPRFSLFTHYLGLLM